MKFLVDVGVGKGVETWLKKTGFDVLSMREINCRAPLLSKIAEKPINTL